MRERRMREPIEMFISLLVRGERVTHEGVTYVMAEDGSLCMLGVRNGEEVGLNLDMDLRGVTQLSNSIGRERLWLMCCELSMQEI